VWEWTCSGSNLTGICTFSAGIGPTRVKIGAIVCLNGCFSGMHTFTDIYHGKPFGVLECGRYLEVLEVKMATMCEFCDEIK
jgi:hypothetical protein